MNQVPSSNRNQSCFRYGCFSPQQGITNVFNDSYAILESKITIWTYEYTIIF